MIREAGTHMPMSDEVCSIDFGFYPKAFDKMSGPITIATLPNLDDKIKDVSSSGCVEGDWIYSPPSQVGEMFSRRIKTRPYSARIFGLPKTHRLSHTNSQGPTHLPFLVFCFGFFAGMRMSETERGFLDATPFVPGKAHDIVWLNDDSQFTAVQYADRFWTAHAAKPRIEVAMRGAIHSYFISRTPTLLEFEEFIYLYTALEGCHYVHSVIQGQDPTKILHNERIEKLCEAFSVSTPAWADSKNSLVTKPRNATLHEGLFFDEPLGFQIFGGRNRNVQDGMLLLQMAALTSRLIIALLGMETCDYVRSPIDLRQRYRVRLEETGGPQQTQ
jgi:hypothetical protein